MSLCTNLPHQVGGHLLVQRELLVAALDVDDKLEAVELLQRRLARGPGRGRGGGRGRGKAPARAGRGAAAEPGARVLFRPELLLHARGHRADQGQR